MAGPMYRQIAEDLLQKIKNGKLGSGDQLPTELELRQMFVTTLPEPECDLGGGEGVSYASQVTALGRKPATTRPRVEIQPATAEIATALRIDVGATVVSRHQQRYIDGTPRSLQTTFYPMSFAEAGAVRLIQATDITEGVVLYLALPFHAGRAPSGAPE